MPDDATYLKVQNQTLYLGAFEANPTYWEAEPGFSFGQFDLNMEAYMPYLEVTNLIESLGSSTKPSFIPVLTSLVQ